MLLIWSLVIFLFIVFLMLAVFRREREVIVYDDLDDEIERTTVTTTVTTTPAQVATVGTIYAFQKQPDITWYVVDPVDNQETEVNANDDYYRDAGGKVWSLM